MITGGYHLILRCDHSDCKMAEPVGFYGDDKSEAENLARTRGWFLSETDYCLCPLHNVDNPKWAMCVYCQGFGFDETITDLTGEARPGEKCKMCKGTGKVPLGKEK